MKVDQRKFFRINVNQAACKLSCNNHTFDGIFVDESIEGLRVSGICIDDSMNLSTCNVIQVTVDHKTVAATPRNLCRLKGGTFAIGLQRENASTPVPDRYFIRQFVSLSGCNIACTILASVDPLQASIRIANGKDFVVEKSRLTDLTIDERRLELETPKQRQRVLVFYSALIPDIDVRSIDDLLDIEFATELCHEELLSV